MIFKLFNKQQGNEGIILDKKESILYNSIVKNLDLMKKKGVDRIILYVTEFEPKDKYTGKWLNFEDSHYYPFDFLIEPEQELILKEKHYKILALVSDNVGGIIKYPKRGIESYERVHIIPQLPKLKKESDLNYITKGGIGLEGDDDFKKVIKEGVKVDWTPELIDKVVESGINYWCEKTEELMNKNERLQRKFEELNKRNCSCIDEILKDVRKNCGYPN